MKLIKEIKFSWTKITSVVFLVLLLGAYAYTFAVPPATKYSAGETLNPNCGPLDPNCSVELTAIESDPIVGNVNGIVKSDGAGNISTAISGTDIKTINGSSLLGSGDMIIAGTYDWSLVGNSGTDGGTNNFLGTTNDVSLTFKVNNTKTGYLGNSTDSNVSFGYRAGFNPTPNKYLTAIGTYALENNTTGQSNAALGFSTLRNNTTGYDNFAMGHAAMATNTTGHSNVGMGGYALYRANGNDNTAVGNASLYYLTSASGNTAIGFHSMFSATTAAQNVSIGWAASNNLTTGSNNTIIGYGTGFGIDTGSGNTIIGANVTGLSGALTDNIIIADGNGNRRINVNDIGNIQFPSYGAGTLTTDASGNVTASSDERLKDIEGSFDNGGNALDIISSINPILYKWNDKSGFDQSTTYAGFSAQNIQEVIPEAVGIDKNGYLTLSDRPILATAVNAIRELDLKVKSIENLDLGNNFQDILISWFSNATNRITRIFTGEICLTDPGEEPECINRSELKALKALISDPDINNGEEDINTDSTETSTDINIEIEPTQIPPSTNETVKQDPSTEETVTPPTDSLE